MIAMAESAVGDSRLRQLLGFLDHDPQNLRLIADAASTAMDEGECGEAVALLDRYAAIEPLTPALLNLKGIAALEEKRFADAAAAFEALRAAGEDAPAIRFNLAWALAMAEEFERALDLLDDDVVAAGARAAALKVSLLHRFERLDEALECGQAFASRYPDDQSLMGALASVALDAERVDLARAYAARSGTNHDGQATLGLLLLDEDRIGESGAIFDRILDSDGGNARALLGKGLGLLATGDAPAAAARIDAAAERFGDHLGSWVAAGWVYYVLGDLATSRARFETALALDENFAETHGALAVLDLADGDVEGARRGAERSVRLDRNSFAGALARSMLLEREGKTAAAGKIRDAALNFPIGPSGRTIARSLAARKG
jgi:tetratricopeptide (TPR) repeat protein